MREGDEHTEEQRRRQWQIWNSKGKIVEKKEKKKIKTFATGEIF